MARLNERQVPVSGCSRYEGYYFRMTRVHLRGMDLLIGDNELCWPYQGRLSFVFASSPELPEPAGHLVLVEMNKARKTDDNMTPEWLLHQPRLKLGRLFLEPVHHLLGWMKCYFMQDMFLLRRQAEPKQEGLASVAIPRQHGGTMRQAREGGFRDLLQDYDANLQRQVRANQRVWPKQPTL